MTMTESSRPPVRLCCGQRHWDVVCPDGKVMCCTCFHRFAIGELHVTEDGPEDVCRGCAAAEEAWWREGPSAYDVATRPGTCITDGEEGIPLERVLRIIRQLPPGEQLVITARQDRKAGGSA